MQEWHERARTSKDGSWIQREQQERGADGERERERGGKGGGKGETNQPLLVNRLYLCILGHKSRARDEVE